MAKKTNLLDMHGRPIEDDSPKPSWVPKDADELFMAVKVQFYPEAYKCGDPITTALNSILNAVTTDPEHKFKNEKEYGMCSQMMWCCIREIITAWTNSPTDVTPTPNSILEITHQHWNNCYSAIWPEPLFYEVCRTFAAPGPQVNNPNLN